jgi:hypothetical protein
LFWWLLGAFGHKFFSTAQRKDDKVKRFAVKHIALSLSPAMGMIFL